MEPCLHPGTPSLFPSMLPSLPLFHFEPCNANHLHHHHHQFVNIVLITLLLVLTSMAVGGLPPERQGWLGHPRYHHLLVHLSPYSLLPRLFPLLLLLLSYSPSSCLFTRLVRLPQSQTPSGVTPRDQARYLPTRIGQPYRPIPPLAIPSAPNRSFLRPHSLTSELVCLPDGLSTICKPLKGRDRSGSLRLSLRINP